jgi:hypothetical protein
MKTQKYIIALCKIAVDLLMLASCTTPVSTLPSQLNATLSPTFSPLPNPTAVPSRSPSPTLFIPTLEPTLPSSQEQRVNELLQNGNCKLPCYLGITPGKTTLSKARAILENLGASYKGEYRRKTDGAIYYTYLLDVGGLPGGDETPRPDGSIMTVSHHVSLITNNDIVQIMEISAGTIGPGTSTAQGRTKFREYWSRYTARGVFLQLGLPTQLYIGTPDPIENGSNLWIAYEKIGVVAQIYGTGGENNVCPEREAKFIDLQLSLFSTATTLETIYNDGRVPPTDRTVWLPIEEVVGISPQEFYQYVISDSSACFKPKVTHP